MSRSFPLATACLLACQLAQSSVASAQQTLPRVGPGPLDSATAVRRALAASPTVALARARIRVARSRVDQSIDLEDPMLMLEARGVDPAIVREPPRETMLSIQQAIPLSSIRSSRSAVAQADTSQASVDAESIAHTVALEADLALVALWQARARMAALSELATTTRAVRDVAVARVVNASATASDVAAADAEIARLEGELEASGARIESERARMRVLLALRPDEPLPDEVDIGEPQAIPSIASAVRTALARRPEQRLEATARERAMAVGRVADGLDAPTLVLGAGVEVMGGQDMPMLMFSAGITLPVFRTARHARYAEATRLAEQAVSEGAFWDREIARDVTVAHGDAVVARVRWRALAERVVPATQRALDAALASYQASGNLSLAANAIRALVSTRVELVDARADVARADAILQHASGLMPMPMDVRGAAR